RTDPPAQAIGARLRDHLESAARGPAAAPIVHLHGGAPEPPQPVDLRDQGGSGVPALCQLTEADCHLRATVVGADPDPPALALSGFVAGRPRLATISSMAGD